MATEGKAATARFATPWNLSIVDTIFACSHIVMEEDSIQTDALASLPANTLSGTQSKLENDSRTAARQELLRIDLCRKIESMQPTTILSLERNVHNIEGASTTYKTDPASNFNTSAEVADSQCGLTSWRSLYERERQHFESLKKQHHRLRSEAERMYLPDLERNFAKSQADLIEARDANATSTEELRKAEAEAHSWRKEAEQHKNKLSQCSEHLNEQNRIHDEDMLGDTKKYHIRIDDSQHWNKDALLRENE